MDHWSLLLAKSSQTSMWEGKPVHRARAEEVLAPLHTITCPLPGVQFTQPHACLSSAEIHSGKSPCPLAYGEAGSTTAGLQASDCSHAPRSWLPGISSILHPQHEEISPGIQPPACQAERESPLLCPTQGECLGPAEGPCLLSVSTQR